MDPMRYVTHAENKQRNTAIAAPFDPPLSGNNAYRHTLFREHNSGLITALVYSRPCTPPYTSMHRLPPLPLTSMSTRSYGRRPGNVRCCSRVRLHSHHCFSVTRRPTTATRTLITQRFPPDWFNLKLLVLQGWLMQHIPFAG